MQTIRNIIFDLGGVILNLDNQRTRDAFVAMGVKGFDNLFGHGHAASFFRDYELGAISDAQFVSNLKELAGISVEDAVVIGGWNAMLLDFPPQRMELLRSLAKRYRLFLFSNTNALHLAALQQIYQSQFKGPALDAHFEKAYYSHLMGLRKPDLESFQMIIEENGLVPSETLFVDDALINVEGARAAGLIGFHLRAPMSLLDVPWDDLDAV